VGESQREDYDTPWKGMLERYFEQFMIFFFPRAHSGIDWSKGYELLDKELQQVVRDAGMGRRFVDKLVKVWQKDGEEAWLLIHVEVQGQAEADFAERMYVYNYRLFDRYRRTVVSLAVLADEDTEWRPGSYRRSLWGCAVSIEFPAVKLLDYGRELERLRESRNPFAVITMAHLRSMASRRDPRARLRWKIELVRMLYSRGFPREDVLELLRFIDWLLVLAPELEREFEEDLAKSEGQRNMEYITTWERRGERRGIEKGRKEGKIKGRLEGKLEAVRENIVELLKVRFGSVPPSVGDALDSIGDLATLNELFRKAVTVDTAEQFARILTRQSE
jgi:hypothetical protein